MATVRTAARPSGIGPRAAVAAALLTVLAVAFGWPATARGDGWYPTPVGIKVVAVAGGYDFNCGIRTNGRLVCWPRFPDDVGANVDPALVDPPKGTFTAVGAGWSHACAIRTSGRIVCWGDNAGGMTSPPSGAFTAIAVGMSGGCALRLDGTIACWGLEEVVPPAGSFTKIDVGQDTYCAIRDTGKAACWGSADNAPFAGNYVVPDETFVGIGITTWFRPCGIRTDGTLRCWGDLPVSASGRFKQVDDTCGVLVDGSLSCWDDDLILPSGRFTAISGMCGIRPSKALVCWDYDPSLPATAAVAPPPSTAADGPDAVVGVWVIRERPEGDMPGARVRVTATHARPARQVLTGDGEGMAFTDLRFSGGAASAHVVITPLVPAGMRLVSGGCDRNRLDGASEGIEPFDVPARSGRVTITLKARQSASCIFTLGPASSSPDTSTWTPTGTRGGWPGLALAVSLVAGLVLGVRRTEPRRNRKLTRR